MRSIFDNKSINLSDGHTAKPYRMSAVRAARLCRTAAAGLLILLCVAALCSCGAIHRTFGAKADVTFDANGGIVTGSGVDTDGPSDPGIYTAKCLVGDALTGFTASKDYYDFTGWFTERDGGRKVTKCPEEDITLYAHWESANKDRSVDIENVKILQGETGSENEITGKTGNEDDPAEEFLVRINAEDSKNDLRLSFTISKRFGQEVYFVNKKGEEKKRIEGFDQASEDSGEEIGFSDEPVTMTCEIPDRNWMDHKSYSYYIQSMGNEHVDKSDILKITIVLDGQCEDFDEPIEGSMVWYGGPDEAPEDRAGVIVATDDDFVYVVSAVSALGEEARSETVYKWKKEDVMINLADVRTDIVYDIYNAYSSRFFPIRGKAMYMDNGAGGLKRYEAIAKEDAMHENRKTGKTTFMVPVQWNFAETVAGAQSAARDMGVTLYIVDSFRPMNSVGPVAKAVDDLSLLAAGGTSAHNFGMAVDTGWQLADENGDPIGDPYDKNLQELDKKKAVKGPRGNEHELWWEGVNKLPQEWWHYGDTLLNADYREHARRVGSLYVNRHECASTKRSKL